MWFCNAILAFLLLIFITQLYAIDPRMPKSWADVLFWGLLITWIQSTEIRTPAKASISHLFIILLAAILIFPLWIPPLLVLVFYLSPGLLTQDYYPLYVDLFNRLQNAISAAVSALVFYWIKGLNVISINDINESLALLFAGVAFFFVNLTLVSLIVSLYEKTSFFYVWRKNIHWLSFSYLVLTPVALLLARMYTASPPLLCGWGGCPVLLFLIPLHYARYHWDEKVKLQEAFEQTVETLMAAIDAKDMYTRMHSERVAAIAEDLARARKLDELEIQKIHLGSRVHDIGKIAIPDQILLKPSPLTPEEYEIIKTHPLTGVDLLKFAKFFKSILPIVRYHHERWDGTGYPEGLAGEKIPLSARIVALADAYETITAGRPHRAPKSPEEALLEIERNAGTQFDPELVELFKKVWATNPLWRDREVFLRHYSSRASSPGSFTDSSEASESKTTPTRK